MRILVAASVSGLCSYEETLAKEVCADLKNKGYTADYFLLPYKDNVLNLPEQIMSYRMLDLSAADMVITIGYPACFLKHPKKYIYLLETAPSIHEYWDTEYGVLGNYQYSQILVAINQLERNTFEAAEHVFCASKLLQEDLNKRYQILSTVMYMPILPTVKKEGQAMISDHYICETYLPQYSRMYDFVKQYNKSGIKDKFVIYIPYSSDVYKNAIEKIIEQFDLQQQISICEGNADDSVIRNANAAVFFPYEMRRPDNFLTRCLQLDIPIVAAKDSGFAKEMCGIENTVAFDSICSKLKAGAQAIKSRHTLENMDSFVRGILAYEDSII